MTYGWRWWWWLSLCERVDCVVWSGWDGAPSSLYRGVGCGKSKVVSYVLSLYIRMVGTVSWVDHEQKTGRWGVNFQVGDIVSDGSGVVLAIFIMNSFSIAASSLRIERDLCLSPRGKVHLAMVFESKPCSLKRLSRCSTASAVSSVVASRTWWKGDTACRGFFDGDVLIGSGLFIGLVQNKQQLEMERW